MASIIDTHTTGDKTNGRTVEVFDNGTTRTERHNEHVSYGIREVFESGMRTTAGRFATVEEAQAIIDSGEWNLGPDAFIVETRTVETSTTVETRIG